MMAQKKLVCYILASALLFLLLASYAEGRPFQRPYDNYNNSSDNNSEDTSDILNRVDFGSKRDHSDTVLAEENVALYLANSPLSPGR